MILVSCAQVLKFGHTLALVSVIDQVAKGVNKRKIDKLRLKISSKRHEIYVYNLKTIDFIYKERMIYNFPTIKREILRGELKMKL